MELQLYTALLSLFTHEILASSSIYETDGQILIKKDSNGHYRAKLTPHKRPYMYMYTSYFLPPPPSYSFILYIIFFLPKGEPCKQPRRSKTQSKDFKISWDSCYYPASNRNNHRTYHISCSHIEGGSELIPLGEAECNI